MLCINEHTVVHHYLTMLTSMVLCIFIHKLSRTGIKIDLFLGQGINFRVNPFQNRDPNLESQASNAHQKNTPVPPPPTPSPLEKRSSKYKVLL